MLTLAQRMLLIALAGVVPLLAVLGYNEISSRQARQKEVSELALSSARQAALEIERLMAGTQNVLKAVSAAPSVRAFDTSLCGPYLADIMSWLPELASIVISDANGMRKCSSDGRLENMGIVDRTFFERALLSPGKLILGEYTVSQLFNRPVLPLIIGIPDKNGKTVAVAAALLDLEWLGKSIRQRPLAKNASLTIADHDGTIIARQPYPEQFVGTQVPPDYLSMVTAAHPGTREVASRDGVRRIVGYIPPAVSPVPGLYISAGISIDDAFREIDRGTLRAAVIAVVAACASIGLALFLSKHLVEGPVRRIHRVLGARRRGKEQVRTQLQSERGEIEALGAELDRFMDELSAATSARDLAEERRQLLMHEMSHRLKNIVATIQSLARQSLRHKTDPEALNAFTQRLSILAQAHHLLLQDDTSQAPLAATITAALGSFADPTEQRVHASGPDLYLRSSAVQCLSMAIHELCTNSAKYGALSVDTGTITVRWTVEADKFTLTWQETRGPPVTAPTSTGFGSRRSKRCSRPS